MMKRSFFTVLFALICTLGFSQVSFNVKAGLNLSSYIGENSDNSKFKPGVRLGVGMEYQFNEMVALQPSLFFSQKGAKYSGDYKGNIADADADVKINQLYLELPISGKSRALLPPSPLRTVHESFPSYGSSNSIFLFVVRNRLILSTFSFISLVAVVVDKLPYNRTTNRYFVDVPCFCTIYFLAA